MNEELKQHLKELLAWTAQQSYWKAEEFAKEFGDMIGEEMYCEQPYYNAYAWRIKHND